MASTDPTGYISLPFELTRGGTWKRPVRVATTANITLSGTQTIDGVACVAGDRVLVKNQSTASQNGIYVVASGAWTRAFDMDQDLTTAVPAEEIAGSVVFVISGTVNSKTIWYTTNVAGGTLGSTSIVWAQFTGGGGTSSGLHWFNVTDVAYGALSDGSTNDRTAINAAIAALNAAGRGVLYFPAGIGYLVSGGALTTITVPCLILGDGAGSSTGAASIISFNHASANCFVLSHDNIRVSGLRIVNTAGSESAGAAIATTTGYGINNRYDNLWIEGFYDGLDLLYGFEWSMSTVHVMNPVRYGARIANIDLPDGGDWSMSDCWFGTRTRDATSAIRIESAGGGKLTNLKINQNGVADQGGGIKRYTTGIDVAIPNAIQTSLLTVASSSIENVTTDGILVTTTGTGTYGLIAITGLEVGLYTNNSGRAVKITAASTGGVGVNGGIGMVTIDGSTFRTDGTARAAIQLTNTDRVTIGDLSLLGFNARYTSSGDTNTIDGAAGTVSSVALTVPAEFSVAGSPVTSSGTLAITSANESANTVWAGPTSGAATTPAFRALVAADIPAGVASSSDHEHIQNVVFSGDGVTTVFILPAGCIDTSSIEVYVTTARSIAWVLSGAINDTLTFDSAPASAANNIVIDIVAATA